MSQDNPGPRERVSNPSVEGEAHAIEDVGVSSENKIDQLIATAVEVKQEVRDRARKVAIIFAIATVFLIIVLGAAGGVLWGLRSQAAELQSIARENRENGRITRQNGTILLEATGPEARARSAATLAKAINDIGRTGVCAAFYAVDEYHPACEDVTRNMDRIRNGENPYMPTP